MTLVCMASNASAPSKSHSVEHSAEKQSVRLRRRHSIAINSGDMTLHCRPETGSSRHRSRDTRVRELATRCRQRGSSVDTERITSHGCSLGSKKSEDYKISDFQSKADEEDSLAERIKCIVLENPLPQECSKSAKLKLLQDELDKESKNLSSVRKTKKYTEEDIVKLKEELDFKSNLQEGCQKYASKTKQLKRYKGDLRTYKKTLDGPVISGQSDTKSLKSQTPVDKLDTSSTESSKVVLHKDSKSVKHPIDFDFKDGGNKIKIREIKEDIIEGGRKVIGKCDLKDGINSDQSSKISLAKNDKFVKTTVLLSTKSSSSVCKQRDTNSGGQSRLIAHKSASESELDNFCDFSQLTNTNITDSEKIKLQGLAKVSKQGNVSTKSNRLSLDCTHIDVSRDTAREVKNDKPNLSGQDVKTGGLPRCASTGQLMVRQCRIGSSVAFGLVQINQNGNGYSEGQGLVTIRMTPDEQGRFGFNVKGGADQGMPIIVSRVAPSTPADIAIPRLNEGDQVLFINGRDVSQHTHEQVVMFIRASRETHSGELVLIVRPNVYLQDPEGTEEPDFVYMPDTHLITTTGGANALEASLVLLQESLESGAALAQFEQLYRKKPGMTMNAARLELNIAKNRYRDISPYDQTRVILKDGNGGEYINANYVNMEIPGSGIVNRYIAAQGPLPNTCVDFWQMVWEQHSSLVVMLTTKVERGRVKCHQYWPDLYDTMDYGELQITCVKEEETTSFAFREFNLTHVTTNEERHISHMQYIAWPDHGVPDDPGDFLEFVVKVRQKRTGMVEPTIVHCSAGIGRTGVLITMETAMCLVESNQPVYPLSIVRQMRDQRAMLIQTPSQYKFVCEAILKVYHDRIVKPLEDYHR